MGAARPTLNLGLVKQFIHGFDDHIFLINRGETQRTVAGRIRVLLVIPQNFKLKGDSK
jgi:hypothetical protein